MGALAGIRVLSLNHFLSGPAAAQFLGDLAADVIAVEPIGGAFQRNWAVGNRFVDDTSVNRMTTGRNKRSLAVDLNPPGGLAGRSEYIGRPAPGATTLAAFARSRPSPEEVPKAWRLVGQLPRDGFGKLRRKALAGEAEPPSGGAA